MNRIVVSMCVAVCACGPAAVEPGLQPLASATASGLTVELRTWSGATLSQGLNHLSYQVTRSGAVVSGARVRQHVSMGDAPCMTHEDAAADDGSTAATLVALSPGSATLAVDVEVDGQQTSVSFAPLTVAERSSFTSFDRDGVEHRLAWGLNGPAKRGRTPVSIAVMRTDSGAAVSDLTMRVHCMMPAMGHGSTGNVDPVHVGDGFYEGSVVMSMSGDWELQLDVTDATVELLSLKQTLAL